MKKLLYLVAIVTLFSVTTLANIADPNRPKAKKSKVIDTTLSISLDRKATQARLVIPKSQIKQLRAELEQLDDASDDTAAVSRTFSQTQTIVSGVFLSLAFVFGGVWFSRSGKTVTKTGKTLAIGAVLFLSGAFATMVFGNAGPPADARSITSKLFTRSVHTYKGAWGKIKLETSDESTAVRLIVPDPPSEEITNEDE